MSEAEMRAVAQRALDESNGGEVVDLAAASITVDDDVVLTRVPIVDVRDVDRWWQRVDPLVQPASMLVDD